MAKYALIFCLLCLGASGAAAADFPKAEIFGGYQYTHLEGSGGASGWNFALNGNFNDWAGITADIGSAYTTSNGVSFDNYTVTFGPVLADRQHKAYTPFVHALIGVDHASAGVFNFSTSSSGLALLAGGGVDARVNQLIAVRVAQVDWMLVHGSGGTSSKNVRISFGVVFRF